MNKASVYSFFCIFFITILIFIVKKSIAGDPFLILGFSAGISFLLYILLVVFKVSKQQDNISKTTLAQSDLDSNKKRQLIKKTHSIMNKNHIKNVEIYVFDSLDLSAYAYQINPLKGQINISKSLLDKYSNKTILGIFAHELVHIQNKDSWRNIVRLLYYIFTSLVFYFFFNKGILLYVMGLYYYDLYAKRKKEYETDLEASKIVSIDEVLNCLIDYYVEEKHSRNKLASNSNNLFEKIITKFKLVQHDLKMTAYNYIGTHPLWKDRIKHIINHYDKTMSDKEIDNLLKKIYYFKVKYPNRAIIWKDYGLTGLKINSIKLQQK